MPNPRKHSKSSKPKDWHIYDLKVIGRGASGLVLLLDESKVVKIPLGTPQSVRDLKVERKVYRQLAQHPSRHILKCYDYDEPRGIVLQRLKESVRKHLTQGNHPPEGEIQKWIMQAAEGLAVLHRNRIIQGDVGCHNMLLDCDNNLKLCDFSGSSIDGCDASIDYETRSQIEFGNKQPTFKTDLFALGSAMYEISTGKPPYHDREDYEVIKLYGAGQFPYDCLGKNEELRHIIKNCWEQHYDSADDVVRDIEKWAPNLRGPEKSSTGSTHGSTTDVLQHRRMTIPWTRRTVTHQHSKSLPLTDLTLNSVLKRDKTSPKKLPGRKNNPNKRAKRECRQDGTVVQKNPKNQLAPFLACFVAPVS